MPTLFGQTLSRRELEARTGRLQQTGGIRTLQFQQGPEDRARVVQVETGTGFQFHILPDRGLDIASAKYCGASLSWDALAGEAHPAHYDPHGLGWLKSFYGGLVCTCGITWAGAPCNDGGVELGLHGRYSNLPVRNLQTAEQWIGNLCLLRVEGDVFETVLFGDRLHCHRIITTELGSNTIRIQDTVSNLGFQPAPHMHLYHMNFGYPLVSENSRLIGNASRVTPRDKIAEEGRESYDRFDPPTPGYKEKVYFHEMSADREGYATVALVNESFNNDRGLGVEIRYRQAELPRFIQWKQMGASDYVCGLEPANCLVMGRADERARGELSHLQPGESKVFDVYLTVLPDRAAIERSEKIIRQN